MTTWTHPVSSWGPWCATCGHPASYHGATFCQVDAGAAQKRPCDCDGYRPVGQGTPDLRDALTAIERPDRENAGG